MKNEKARTLMWWLGLAALAIAVVVFVVDLCKLWDPGSEVSYIFLGLSYIALAARNWDKERLGSSVFTLFCGLFILVGGIVMLLT